MREVLERRRFRTYPLVGLATALLAATAAGCTSEDTGSAHFSTVPAKGKVSVAGKAVTKGVITLEPLVDGGSTNQATGEVKADGTFELMSGGDKLGAMPGKYRVKLETEGVKPKRKAGEEVKVEVKDGQDLDIQIP